MSPAGTASNPRHTYHYIAVGVLCVAFFLQCFFASRIKSPTADETNHITSGATYVFLRSIVANPQHPPLIKELAGLSLMLAGARFQQPLTRQELESDRQRGVSWEAGPAGQRFLMDNGVSRTLFWARFPMLLLSPLLGLLIYFCGRQLDSSLAGVCGAFLFAVDPTMVAHGYLVTTDMGVALFGLIFLMALFRYTQAPSRRRMIGTGVALGLALGSKFSAVFLLPIAGVLLLAAYWWPPQQVDSPPVKKKKKRAAENRRLLPTVTAFGWMLLIAAVVLQVLYFSITGPAQYLQGLNSVNGDHNPNAMAYLHGELKHSFPSYFATAWMLKEPLATVVLAIAGILLILRRSSVTRVPKLFLLLPPAAFLIACMGWADNIGVRYLMPAMPFAYIAGGITLAWLLQGSNVRRAMAALACVWLTVAAAGIYPDHLSYFNEAACVPEHVSRIGLDGGSRCGVDWLADSNVDWGGSLPQLKQWLSDNATGRPLRLEAFVTFPIEAYGLEAEKAGPYLTRTPPPGLYAISAHTVATNASRGFDWLGADPAAIVAHAYYIFDIRP